MIPTDKKAIKSYTSKLCYSILPLVESTVTSLQKLQTNKELLNKLAIRPKPYISTRYEEIRSEKFRDISIELNDLIRQGLFRTDYCSENYYKEKKN